MDQETAEKIFSFWSHNDGLSLIDYFKHVCELDPNDNISSLTYMFLTRVAKSRDIEILIPNDVHFEGKWNNVISSLSNNGYVVTVNDRILTVSRRDKVKTNCILVIDVDINICLVTINTDLLNTDPISTFPISTNSSGKDITNKGTISVQYKCRVSDGFRMVDVKYVDDNIVRTIIDRDAIYTLSPQVSNEDFLSVDDCLHELYDREIVHDGYKINRLVTKVERDTYGRLVIETQVSSPIVHEHKSIPLDFEINFSNHEIGMIMSKVKTIGKRYHPFSSIFSHLSSSSVYPSPIMAIDKPISVDKSLIEIEKSALPNGYTMYKTYYNGILHGPVYECLLSSITVGSHFNGYKHGDWYGPQHSSIDYKYGVEMQSKSQWGNITSYISPEHRDLALQIRNWSLLSHKDESDVPTIENGVITRTQTCYLRLKPSSTNFFH